MSKPERKPVPYGAIALRADIIAVLDEVAAKLGKTREEVAEEALLTFLEDAEDGIAAAEAEREWEASGRKSVTAEELYAKYGLKPGA